jgi:hypothetical protein
MSAYENVKPSSRSRGIRAFACFICFGGGKASRFRGIAAQACVACRPRRRESGQAHYERCARCTRLECREAGERCQWCPKSEGARSAA